jgi:hypothetical protein
MAGSDGWGMSWEAGQLPAGNYMVKASTTDYAGNDGSGAQNVNLPPH